MVAVTAAGRERADVGVEKYGEHGVGDAEPPVRDCSRVVGDAGGLPPRHIDLSPAMNMGPR